MQVGAPAERPRQRRARRTGPARRTGGRPCLRLLLVLLDQLGRHVRAISSCLDQALEAVFFVEGLRAPRVCWRADGDGVQRRQAGDVVRRGRSRCGWSRSARPCGSQSERLAQVLAGRALDLGGARHQRVERAVFQQPLRGRLGADLVARRARCRPCRPPASGSRPSGAAARRTRPRRRPRRACLSFMVSMMVMCSLTSWLRSLSPLETITSMPCSAAMHGQRADHVVGLDAGHGQHLPAEQAHHLVDRLDLAAQVVRHGRAVGLVLGIPVVAEGLALARRTCRRRSRPARPCAASASC